MTKDTITIKVGDYIFKRLSELTKTIFGVPGDFNLRLLEHIYHFDESTIKWRGNNNELNAGYCADGYARINGFGCLISTFGVGELSALNAIAGAFAENVSLLHIVGTSPSMMKSNSNTVFQNLHHLIPSKKTYGAQNHQVYENLVDDFSCCTEKLTLDDISQNTIQDKVDHVLEQIIYEMKPGYLFVPCDMPDMEFEMKASKKLNLKLDANRELSVQETEILEYLLEETYKSGNPGFVGDLFLRNEKLEVMDLLQKTNWYCYSTFCSRGAIFDESLPNFQGVFTNEYSTPHTLKIMESNDFIMHWGSNINETSFKIRSNCNEEWLQSCNIIFLGKDYAQIGYGANAKQYTENVNCSRIFNAYMEKLDVEKLEKIQTRSEQDSVSHLLPQWSDSYECSNTNGPLTQSGFSKMLSTKGFFQEGDVVVNELSSFIFEMENVKLPPNGLSVHQGFYASIGYALPATLGVCIALKDLDMEDKRRVILLQGDGAAQMTFQELGCFLSYDIFPLVFMFNNAGYTVEREIEGRYSSYNDLTSDWDWSTMLRSFGDKDQLKHYATKVRTFEELNVLNKKIIQDQQYDHKLRFFECMFDKMDVPTNLKKFVSKEQSRV